MNFIEYITYLRKNKLEARFYVERSSDGHHPFQIHQRFVLPNAKLTKESFYDRLTGDGNVSSFEKLVTLDGSGKLMSKKYQYIYWSGTEAWGDRVDWPNLSYAILSLPSVLLEKYFNKKKITDISEIDPSLLKTIYVHYEYEKGLGSAHMSIGDEKIDDEKFNQSLRDMITESVEIELINHDAEKDLMRVTITYFGSDKAEEFYGDYTEILEDSTTEIIDLKDCFLNEMELEFELIDPHKYNLTSNTNIKSVPQKIKEQSNQKKVREQFCANCKKSVQPLGRYPKYICKECSKLLTDIEGRPVYFVNTHDFGYGCQGYYDDTDEKYNLNIGYIAGEEYYADEARFGGIVIQLSEK